ncbi:MAG: CvpA family protein [Bacillota bacterium]
MNWVDWVIAAVFGWFIFRGFRRGFIQQFFDLLGSIFAMVLGFYYYQRVGEYIAANFHFSTPLANVLGFILIVAGICMAVSLIGGYWHKVTKDEPVAVFDGAFGAVLGGFKAAVILVMVLLILIALPWSFFHGPIEVSSFANDLLRLAPYFYLIQDQSLPPDIPRLVVSPEGLQLRRVKGKNLEGATCIACGAKVRYLGFVKEGLFYYPQTYCPKCHRTSDGCLTFEGYHMINGVCPYAKLGSLGVIDCKVWPNIEPTTVHGKCPVCGRSQ